MTSTGDESVATETALYPAADLTAAEFEVFVTSLFDALKEIEGIAELQIQNHEKVAGVDGSYDFDATVRYELAGMKFVILVEAKLHKHPIKRELVQVLHSKLQSVGAHKAVLISSAPFQIGALQFALTHGIALVTVTEGRFTYETKSAEQAPQLTREEAAAHFGLPTFVSHSYSASDLSDSIVVTTMSTGYPESVQEVFTVAE